MQKKGESLGGPNDGKRNGGREGGEERGSFTVVPLKMQMFAFETSLLSPSVVLPRVRQEYAIISGGAC